MQTVRRLIEQGGIYVNARNNNDSGSTPTFHANDVDIMRILIANGAQVNSTDDYGLTPLFTIGWLGTRDKEACCELLLSNNADIEAETRFGSTPLHVAASQGQSEIVRLLLIRQRSRHGREGISSLLVQTDVPYRANALHRAGSTSSAETARLLVEQCRGDDGVLVPACHQIMIAKDWDGCTPLDLARKNTRSTANRAVEYLESFQVLPLAAPPASSDGVAVMLNPRLDDFQHAIATECGELIRTTCCTTEVVVYIVLGYLSPLDVMKR